MRNNIRIFILISAMPLLLTAGCISTKTIPEKEKVHYYKPPPISNETLNTRIDEIKKLLEENSLSEDRKDTAISVLKAYDKLKALNKEGITEKEYRKAVQLLFKSLVAVEQQYLYSGLVSGDNAWEIIIENYSALKKQIYENYFAGDLNGVISGCKELISRFGKSGLTPDLGIILFEALSKSNMASDALALSGNIIGAAENQPDLILLLTDAIELEIKRGNVEGARHLYEKLVDDMSEKNSLYEKAGNLLSKYQSNGSEVEESLKEKIIGMDPEKKIEMEQLMEDVKILISQKDFSGARLELVRRRLRAEEGPELEMIEQMWKSVDKAEERFDKTNNNDRLIIEDARRLIEEEKYEEALDILEPVAAAGDNYEAEKIKKEAVEKLINRKN